MSVVIETSIGDLVIDLYTEERPNCCKNFLKLCKIKYFHFCLFHNIQKNFIAQTGDPEGTGRGGESIYSFLYGDQAKYFEMEKFPIIKHRKLGAVSMINNGQDMHGSQFLITLAENCDYLNGKHTVFGEVAKGFDVLEKLNEWICDKEGRPYQDIRIFHTVILHDPFEDFAAMNQLLNGRQSPEPTEERIKSDRIRVDEEVDQLEGMSPDEIDAYMKQREAKTRAKLLEIIGDIPDADVKPPENVLFVCKLNPVTTDEDLELIFSRFGPIASCEVIRDRKSGDSLCYAFIEFENEADCESAYFKMDNVLIDDRRIHVDFSQSVAKVKWKGKGTGTGYFEDSTNYRNEDADSDSRQQYKVVNRSRRGEGYDLVFDEAEASHDHAKYRKMNEGGRTRDTGGVPQQQHYRSDRDRDRDRDRDHHRDSRNSDHYRDRDRDREKNREMDKDRDRDRDRDRRDRDDRNRDRDRKDEHHQHKDKDKHHKSSSSSSSSHHHRH